LQTKENARKKVVFNVSCFLIFLVSSLGKCENKGRQQPGKEKSRRRFGKKTTERNEGCKEIANNENQEGERGGGGNSKVCLYSNRNQSSPAEFKCSALKVVSFFPLFFFHCLISFLSAGPYVDLLYSALLCTLSVWLS
jgi:hypothetical protein